MIRIYTSRRCLAHKASGGYPERPDRLQAILDHLGASDTYSGSIFEETDADRICDAAIRAVHDERYVRRLLKAVERGDGLIDSPDNPLSSGTWDAATAAVEATLTAAEWAAGGEGRHAFAAVRPPGHHAERDRAMGFCFFNNVAVAAERLLSAGLAERLAIFDFDLHHGNGTQHLFEDRPEVFYASTHQSPYYPGTGAASERGEGAGEGTVLNVPLPAGTGEEEYLEAVDREVLPALRDWKPDFLAVSAGFDTWKGDPLGGFGVTEEGFRGLGTRVAGLAAECCGGRSLTVLEGGYDLRALPRVVEAYLDGLRQGTA
ncbi:MAG: histone deacetylase [Acidobacteriota bacterium]|jgi:acetoin utilization deacetylase AcuC-like enzyme